MGIAQNLKKEEDVIVARGIGATSVVAGLGQARSQVLFAGGSTTKEQVVLEHVIRQRNGNTNYRRLECVAHDTFFFFRKATVNFKFKCNVLKATVKGAHFSGLCALAGLDGSFTENEVLPLEACHYGLASWVLAIWSGGTRTVNQQEDKSRTKRCTKILE